MNIELYEESFVEKVVILQGLRACMGSGSYAAQCGIDFIKNHWLGLPESVRNNVARDLLEWLGDVAWVANDKKPYWSDWYALMQFVTEKSPEVGAWAVRANLHKKARFVGVDEFMGVHE